MFTGIVTDLGRVRMLDKRGDTRIEIETAFDTSEIDLGASIACSGPCLTVVEKGPGWFAVDASAETMARTTLGDWVEGTPVNLERALKVGDEPGGHTGSGRAAEPGRGGSRPGCSGVSSEYRIRRAENGAGALPGVRGRVRRVRPGGRLAPQLIMRGEHIAVSLL